MSIWVDHSGLKHLLKKLKDVLISSPQDGQVLTYRASDKKWINRAPTAGAAHDVSYVQGVTDISRSSMSFVRMDDMYISKTFGANRVLCFWKAGIQATVTDVLGEFRLRRDGTEICADNQWFNPPQGINIPSMVFLFWTEVLSAGSHYYEILWRLSGGTGVLWNYSSNVRFRRIFTIIELLA